MILTDSVKGLLQPDGKYRWGRLFLFIIMHRKNLSKQQGGIRRKPENLIQKNLRTSMSLG